MVLFFYFQWGFFLDVFSPAPGLEMHSEGILVCGGTSGPLVSALSVRGSKVIRWVIVVVGPYCSVIHSA